MFEDQKKASPPPPAPRLNLPDLGAGLEIPKGAAKSPTPTFAIHVMPKEYYGIAPKTPVKKVVTESRPKPPSPPPPPKPEKSMILAGQIKKRRVPVVLIIGMLFVVVIALGGYLFLRSIRQPTPAPIAITPQPEPEPEPLPPPPPAPTPEPELIRPGIDTDSDGLTDIEEQRIYFTNPSNPDSDGDSFIDGNEVYHLYDPSSPTPAALSEATAVMRQETLGTVNVLVPIAWTRQPGAPQYAATLVAENDDRMNILVEPGAGKTLLGVYQGTAPGRTPAPFTSKRGYPGLRHPDYLDQRRIILAVGEQFFTVDYDLGESVRTIEYLRTFEMVVNSLRLND